MNVHKRVDNRGWGVGVRANWFKSFESKLIVDCERSSIISTFKPLGICFHTSLDATTPMKFLP